MNDNEHIKCLKQQNLLLQTEIWELEEKVKKLQKETELRVRKAAGELKEVASVIFEEIFAEGLLEPQELVVKTLPPKKYGIYIFFGEDNLPFYVGKGTVGRPYSDTSRSEEFQQRLKNSRFIMAWASDSSSGAYRIEKRVIEIVAQLYPDSLINKTHNVIEYA